MTQEKTLRDIREKKNYTREQIASALGVSAQTVYFWESGRRKITANNLLKLAKFYKMPFLKLVVKMYGDMDKDGAAIK